MGKKRKALNMVCVFTLNIAPKVSGRILLSRIAGQSVSDIGEYRENPVK